MRRNTTFAIAGIGVLVLAAVGYFGAGLFLPEQSTTVDESDANDRAATVLATGEFVGKAGHAVSGTVELREDEEGYYLYFRNYSQTQGPDVYTPGHDPFHPIDDRSVGSRYGDGNPTTPLFTQSSPGVYLYLTPDADPDTSAAIRAGTKVLVDGGADGGEFTKEGTFSQRLPDDVDPTGFQGVAVWCDRFAVPFGAATLTDTTG